MAFHTDFDCFLTGGQISYRKTSVNHAASIPRGQGLTVSFHALDGPVHVTVTALNFRDPTRTQIVGPHVDPRDPTQGPGSEIEEYNHVPCTVELFAPGNTHPVSSRGTGEGWSRDESLDFTYVVGGTGGAAGNWQCRVTNKGTIAAAIDVSVRAIFDRQPLHSTALPLQLIDHAYQLILEAVTPSARVSGHTLTVSFGAELVDFFGNAGGVLGPQVITLPLGIEGNGRMQTISLDTSSGGKLLEAMLMRWQEKKTGYETNLQIATDFTVRQNLQHALQQNDEWRAKWEQRVNPDFAVIHAQAVFSNIQLERDLDLILGHVAVDVADIQGSTVDLFLAFEPGMEWGASLVLAPVKVTGGVVKWAEELGLIDVGDWIEDSLTKTIDSALPLVSRYLAEAFGRLSARDCVFMRLTVDDFAWNVAYTSLPQEASGGPGGDLGSGAVGGVGAPDDSSADSLDGGDTGMSPPTGDYPEDVFIVRSPETLDRLDNIDTIVVVMMENRSFDHLFGYLRMGRGTQYEGLLGTESNVVAGRAHPVLIQKASDIVPNPVTKITQGPHHEFDFVKTQVDNGHMSGFAQDYENRYPGKGETAMTYYTDRELPLYYQLADSFKVCDHWFAAHPGATWPNRWTTLSGATPRLRNPELDDADIGFFEGHTIFELLESRGVEWLLFESDLSLIRTYNRYRLDTKRVVPFHNRHDNSQSFAARAAAGLPSVVFIEPNFSDLPPLSTANDDLCPVDLRRGQNFISEIYNALSATSHWNRTLLLITYDEHGGFYDHVPPPGTALGPPEFLGKIPRIHPDGADYLGVRVPTIVASPLVNPGEVCKEVFDHTSIIKTILTRYRGKLYASDFTRFGERVNQANHLGLAIDLSGPRPGKAKRLSRIPILKATPQPKTPKAQIATKQTDDDDFPETLRRGFLPKKAQQPPHR